MLPLSLKDLDNVLWDWSWDHACLTKHWLKIIKGQICEFGTNWISAGLQVQIVLALSNHCKSASNDIFFSSALSLKCIPRALKPFFIVYPTWTSNCFVFLSRSARINNTSLTQQSRGCNIEVLFCLSG